MKKLLTAALAALAVAPAALAAPPAADVRFATFNASLNRGAEGMLREHLSDPHADTVYVRQAKNVAEVVQRIRPDVLLINEFDFDPVARDLFRDNFLAVSQNGAKPIRYRYSFIAPSNTGVASGHDLDNNGSVGGPNDAFGFGLFPGQFGMVVYSRYPIDPLAVRTFQTFLWKDMPGALLPDDPSTSEPADWYSPEELDVFRLSSKSHWDIPVQTRQGTVHFLVSHPTPPVFDGAEDRNGTRNHDEIRLWADYVSPARSGYIYDDAGRHGGLEEGALFVVAGDQNSDPLDGDSIPGAIQQLIEHPLVNVDETPESDGAKEAAELQGRANLTHRSDPKFDTADFNDSAPGNLRADYVLPSRALEIGDAGVFWPELEDPLSRLTGRFSFDWIAVGGFPTSDHRAVWVDVSVPTQ